MKNNLKLLIKFPTRGRPEKFFNVLNKYIEMAHEHNSIAFLISMDADDKSMNNDIIKNKLNDIQKTVKLVYFYGNSKTKIEAINADMGNVSGWDIVLLASDDMIPIVHGYDCIIRDHMKEFFRNTDGCLWYSDGGQNNICTLSILGKKYYDRFEYIYNPEYKSLWCDNEHTDVMTQLGKVYKSDQVIIEHQHPVYQKTNYDELYVRNESYFNIDREIYEKRKVKNFDLNLNYPLLSILTPSITSRMDSHLKKLIEKLKKQIGNSNVEHLILTDNRKRSIGEKRQSLLDVSNGKYVTFIDDDDDISDDYIECVLNAIEENADVITFKQKCLINNNPPSIINFSLQNKENEPYLPGMLINRMPFHVCIWKSKIAKKYKFPSTSYSEDWFWVEQLLKEVKTEFHIDKAIHSYIYDENVTTTPL